MSQFAIDQVLSQIRALQATQRNAITPPAAPGVGAATQGNGATSFAKVLQQGLEKVNATQVAADAKAQAFARGTPGVELGEVMVEAQKAQVAFRATVEVRNRFVAAYQDIMNMPI
jgi:flagellar hook-basal body complex protein FliE